MSQVRIDVLTTNPSNDNQADQKSQADEPSEIMPPHDKQSEKSLVHELKEMIKKNKQGWEKEQDMVEKRREWLMLLATLAVTITYTAGLNPPGGFWQDDGKGHAAGTPVLQSKSHARYMVFYYSNGMAFVTSLIIIALLISKKVGVEALSMITMLGFLCLVVSYIAGCTSDLLPSIGLILVTGVAFLYLSYRWVSRAFL
jgi:hypothetical protein